MAKLIVSVNTYSPATTVVNNTQVIRIAAGHITPLVIGGSTTASQLISADVNNDLRIGSDDKLFVTRIENPTTIQSWITTFNDNLT